MILLYFSSLYCKKSIHSTCSAYSLRVSYLVGSSSIAVVCCAFGSNFSIAQSPALGSSIVSVSCISARLIKYSATSGGVGKN